MTTTRNRIFLDLQNHLQAYQQVLPISFADEGGRRLPSAAPTWRRVVHHKGDLFARTALRASAPVMLTSFRPAAPPHRGLYPAAPLPRVQP